MFCDIVTCRIFLLEEPHRNVLATGVSNVQNISQHFSFTRNSRISSSRALSCKNALQIYNAEKFEEHCRRGFRSKI